MLSSISACLFKVWSHNDDTILLKDCHMPFWALVAPRGTPTAHRNTGVWLCAKGVIYRSCINLESILLPSLHQCSPVAVQLSNPTQQAPID